MKIVDYHLTEGISIIDFKKPIFSLDSIKIVLLYRKNNTSLPAFYHNLADILQLDTVHIILGDFNIYAQDQEQTRTLLQILQNYQQIVQEPTHLGGAILDHIYVRKSFLKDFKLECFVKCVYFSDHDAVQFNLTL